MPSSRMNVATSSSSYLSVKKAHKRFNDDEQTDDGLNNGHAAMPVDVEASLDDEQDEDSDAPPEELDTVSAKQAVKARRRQVQAAAKVNKKKRSSVAERTAKNLIGHDEDDIYGHAIPDQRRQLEAGASIIPDAAPSTVKLDEPTSEYTDRERPIPPQASSRLDPELFKKAALDFQRAKRAAIMPLPSDPVQTVQTAPRKRKLHHVYDGTKEENEVANGPLRRQDGDTTIQQLHAGRNAAIDTDAAAPSKSSTAFVRQRLFRPRRTNVPKSHRKPGAEPPLPASLFDPLLDKPKTNVKAKKEGLLNRQQRLRGRQPASAAYTRLLGRVRGSALPVNFASK